MKTITILVGHGQLPKDLPDEIRREYFALRAKRNRTREEEERYQELERRIVNWPRNEQNDPYWSNINKLAEVLRQLGGFNRVIPAFNEFCSPLLEEALEEACREDCDRIIVIPTMLIPGGVHSEEEIPEAIEKVRQRCRSEIIYLWPFDIREIARMLLEHLSKFKEG